MAGDGSRLKRLTNQSGTDFDPSWSPDGRAIVFRTSRGHYAPDPNGTGTEGILVVDAMSGQERQLFPRSASEVGALFPDWAPSGNLVALSTLDNKLQERIAVIDAATSITVYDTGNGSVRLIAGRLGSDSLWFPGPVAR